MIVILDSGVLGLLASPIQDASEEEENEIYQCTEWLYSLLSKSVYVVTSEISDYEVRRELIRIKSDGIGLLDNLRDVIDFLPLTKEVMKKAAEFWADARQNHIPTADDKNIDADMIISAQWSLLSEKYPGRTVLIATKNIRHLKLFAQENAQDWMNIRV
ncbi:MULTISPECIES: type II toxin-antitoxin system VapC family toxin [unclassified Coleofasciculus]|uniref:type II toxin-antitoxin system VapC family toxin n=1 Tax=unclassified Coleofasciculus TaxID=2692782 RepID=UPI0018819E0F|nr:MULTISPECIES: type II toxin-antitoxin system VapC family toxin [unclassified Coleofasciculus]MBE9129735.1 type II toxin-antitoxin system VapC family toxin [Coleofasciculus sp. LEGE 07081]MBE9151150.1 type II toxin-antitoxin system VapC family toxin [Coleofasciculus sp. LEGE 07092]